jgi:hypothetical protein
VKRGSRHTSYQPATVARVAELLANHEGPENAATWDRLAKESGIAQRRLRQIASDLDGVSWLIGYVDPDEVSEGEPYGIHACRCPEDALSLTLHIRSKALDELGRLRRRRAYARAMRLPEPVAQLEMRWAS